jgi:O-methyltransferase involved in polyketide biosynthesis
MSTSNEMDKISFTADLSGLVRSLTNIPYSKEIHEILSEKVKGTQVEIELREAIEFDMLRITPVMECRYKLSDKLMEENGAIKVLELAAGLSPRGFKWTENPQITYVEFDLPHKIKEKRQIVEELISQLKMNSHPNLYFVAGDVLHREDMITATTHFQASDGPIVIVSEGLLPYLTHEQKKMMAENIKYLLNRLGGCWITTDINFPSIDQSDPFSQLRTAEVIHDYFQFKGIQMYPFESVVFAKSFFEELGFLVEQRCYREVLLEMVAPFHRNASKDELENEVGSRISFVMRCKSTLYSSKS